MQLLFSAMLVFQLILTATLVFGIVATLLHLAPGAALKPGELVVAIALSALSGGFAWMAWPLRQSDALSAGLLTLAGFWLLLVLAVIIAAVRARWN